MRKRTSNQTLDLDMTPVVEPAAIQNAQATIQEPVVVQHPDRRKPAAAETALSVRSTEVVQANGTTGQAVALADPGGTAATLATAVLDVVYRAARDSSVDVAKMRELLTLQKEILADRAKAEYKAAMSQLQSKLPTLGRGGRIEVRDKQTNEVKSSTPYAKYEDIMDVVGPMLTEHGFAVSFDSQPAAAPAGHTTFFCELSHCGGHSEIKQITLPIDASGFKNGPQGVGSIVSYAQRYLLTKMHLNIRTRGEDQDGQLIEPISEEQVNWIVDAEAYLEFTPAQESQVLTWMKVKALSEISKRDFPRLYEVLRQRMKAKRAADQAGKTYAPPPIGSDPTQTTKGGPNR